MEFDLSSIDLTTLALNGAGGAILGPLVAQFLGGANSSILARIVAGVAGGLGAGYGAQEAGIGSLLGDTELMRMAQSVLEGGVGGGILSTIGGFMTKKNR